ncbi:MAG: RDD family protein, partial [Bryobacteraceae bacterium]
MIFCPGCGSRVEGLPQPAADAAGPPPQPPQGYVPQPAVPPPQPGQPYYPPGYGPPPGFGPPPGYAPYAAAPQWAPYPMVKYAGFWRRFAAALIDGLAFGACFWIVAFILMLIAGVGTGGFAAIEPGSGPPVGMIVPIVLLVYVVGPAGFWLYSALMESSARQATL